MQDAQASAADVASRPERRPGSSLRFVALRSTADDSLALRFHPRLTVVTGFGERAPGLVADALRLARSGDASGIAELDGALVPLSRLPADIAALAPRVVGPVDLRAALARLTGATRDRLDDEIDAVGELVIEVEAACIQASGRIEAMESGIRTLEHGITELAARRETALESLGPRPEAPEVLESLLSAAEEAAALPRVTDPEAEELARSWEALEAASAIRRARSDIAADLRAREDEVRAARERLIRLRTATRSVEPAELYEATRLRKAWTEARARTATRFAGARRRTAAEQARDAYDAHLRRFGVSSVEELASIGRKPTPDDDPEVRQAAGELAAAEQRCEELRFLLRAPDDQREATRIVMRARARRILGREPDRDLVADLRSHRLDPPEHAQAQVALAAALRALQIRVETTLEAAARDWIGAQHEQRHAWEQRQAEIRQLDAQVGQRRAELAAARHELVEAGRELERLTAELEDLRFEQRRLEQRRSEHEHVQPGVELDEVTPSQIPHLLHVAAGLDRPSRGGDRPVVVDDLFDDVQAGARRHVLSGLLSLAWRLQVVVFTDDGEVVEWARRAGDDFALVWSPAALDDERASRRSLRTAGR